MCLNAEKKWDMQRSLRDRHSCKSGDAMRLESFSNSISALWQLCWWSLVIILGFFWSPFGAARIWLLWQSQWFWFLTLRPIRMWADAHLALFSASFSGWSTERLRFAGLEPKICTQTMFWKRSIKWLRRTEYVTLELLASSFMKTDKVNVKCKTVISIWFGASICT